jgi:hypothetical protein
MFDAADFIWRRNAAEASDQPDEGILDKILGELGIPSQEIGKPERGPGMLRLQPLQSPNPGSPRTPPAFAVIPALGSAVVPPRGPAHRLGFGRSSEHAPVEAPSFPRS